MSITLETERLILRRLRPGDLDDLHAVRSDPEVCRYQGYSPATLEETRGFIEWQKEKDFGTPGEWFKLGMELKNGNKLIGDIALKSETDVRLVEFGISLSRDHWGKGVASEALSAVFDHLFNKEGIHRITAIMDVDNTAIIRLVERFGFRREGHYIKSFFDNGEWRDEYLYALLPEEWERELVTRAARTH